MVWLLKGIGKIFRYCWSSFLLIDLSISKQAKKVFLKNYMTLLHKIKRMALEQYLNFMFCYREGNNPETPDKNQQPY